MIHFDCTFQLQDTVKYATNSLIFGMFDKYFVAPEESLLQVYI